MAIEHADFDGVDRLSKVTGAEICSTFDHPEAVKLGTKKKNILHLHLNFTINIHFFSIYYLLFTWYII